MIGHGIPASFLPGPEAVPALRRLSVKGPAPDTPCRRSGAASAQVVALSYRLSRERVLLRYPHRPATGAPTGVDRGYNWC
jgi:hypothetical protein